MKKTTKLLALIFLLIVINKVTVAQWTQEPFTPGRSLLTAAANKKAAIFYGGINSNISIAGRSDHFNIYDITTHTWVAGTHGKGRQSAAATSLGPRIYFGGGYAGFENGQYQSQINIYNTDSAKWEHDKDLIKAREKLAAAAAGSKVLFAGGMYLNKLQTKEIVTDTVDIFDTLTGSHTVERLSQRRMGLCGASSGNIILFAGGRTLLNGIASWGPPSKVVDIYNVCTGTWSVDSLSQARSGSVAVASGTKIYIAGGQIGTDVGARVSRVIDIYDVETKVWTTDSLIIGRNFLSAAATNNFVMFAGGTGRQLFPQGSISTFYDTVEIYDVANNSWTRSRLNRIRGWAAAAAIDDKFFVAGGSPGQVNFNNNVDVYQIQASTQIPTGVTVSNLNCNGKSATLTWTSSLTSNTIRYRKIGDCDWMDTTITGTTGTILGLTTDTNYEVQVRANSPTSGISDYSISTNFTNRDLSVTVPEGLAVSNINRTDVSLNWNPTLHVSSYALQYKIDTASTWTIIPNVPSNNFLLGGLTTNTHYQVAVKAKNSCDNSAYCNTVGFLTTGLGIDQLNEGIQFSIFPNPASDIITLISPEIKEKGEIKIQNNIGQVLYNKDIPANTSSININIEHLPSGIYFISISNGKTNSIKKFVRE